MPRSLKEYHIQLQLGVPWTMHSILCKGNPDMHQTTKSFVVIFALSSNYIWFMATLESFQGKRYSEVGCHCLPQCSHPKLLPWSPINQDWPCLISNIWQDWPSLDCQGQGTESYRSSKTKQTILSCHFSIHLFQRTIPFSAVMTLSKLLKRALQNIFLIFAILV